METSMQVIQWQLSRFKLLYLEISHCARMIGLTRNEVHQDMVVFVLTMTLIQYKFQFMLPSFVHETIKHRRKSPEKTLFVRNPPEISCLLRLQEELADQLKRNSRPTELGLRFALGAADAEAAGVFSTSTQLVRSGASFGVLRPRVLRFILNFLQPRRTAGGGRRSWRKPWRSTVSSPRSTSIVKITLETLVLRPFVFLFFWGVENSWNFDCQILSDCLVLQALAEMLKVNTTLSVLILGNNQIGDSGVEALGLLPQKAFSQSFGSDFGPCVFQPCILICEV